MYSYYISCLFCFSYFAIIHRNHPRPSLPSDVLIALAVRNLDPSNQLVIHSDLMRPIIPLVAKSSNLWIRCKYGAVDICQKNICHITGSLLHAHHCLPVPPLPLLQQAARRMQKHGWLIIEMFSKASFSSPLHRWHSFDKITKTTSTSSSMSAETWLKYHKNLFKTPSPPLITKILLQIFFSVWFAPKHRLALCRFGKRMTWMRMMRLVEKTSGSRQTCYLSFSIVFFSKLIIKL